MKLDLIFSPSELRKHIPYALVCETRYGCRWNTMKRKRLWKEMFTDAERSKISGYMFLQAHRWHLGNGGYRGPQDVRMSTSTYLLWQKLGEFCAML